MLDISDWCYGVGWLHFCSQFTSIPCIFVLSACQHEHLYSMLSWIKDSPQAAAWASQMSLASISRVNTSAELVQNRSGAGGSCWKRGVADRVPRSSKTQRTLLPLQLPTTITCAQAHRRLKGCPSAELSAPLRDTRENKHVQNGRTAAAWLEWIGFFCTFKTRLHNSTTALHWVQRRARGMKHLSYEGKLRHSGLLRLEKRKPWDGLKQPSVPKGACRRQGEGVTRTREWFQTEGGSV